MATDKAGEQRANNLLRILDREIFGRTLQVEKIGEAVGLVMDFLNAAEASTAEQSPEPQTSQRERLIGATTTWSPHICPTDHISHAATQFVLFQVRRITLTARTVVIARTRIRCSHELAHGSVGESPEREMPSRQRFKTSIPKVRVSRYENLLKIGECGRIWYAPATPPCKHPMRRTQGLTISASASYVGAEYHNPAERVAAPPEPTECGGPSCRRR
jgi:hypothetical protein